MDVLNAISLALQTEIAAGRLSASFTPAEGVVALSAEVIFNLDVVKGSDIFNAIDPTEWAVLTDAQKQSARDVFGLGDIIPVGPGTNVRVVLLALFDAQSITRANLIQLTRISEKVFQHYGIPEKYVTEAAITKATGG